MPAIAPGCHAYLPAHTEVLPGSRPHSPPTITCSPLHHAATFQYPHRFDAAFIHFVRWVVRCTAVSATFLDAHGRDVGSVCLRAAPFWLLHHWRHYHTARFGTVDAQLDAACLPAGTTATVVYTFLTSFLSPAFCLPPADICLRALAPAPASNAYRARITYHCLTTPPLLYTAGCGSRLPVKQHYSVHLVPCRHATHHSSAFLPAHRRPPAAPAYSTLPFPRLPSVCPHTYHALVPAWPHLPLYMTCGEQLNLP